MKAGKWIGVGMLITLGVIVAGMAVFWLLSGLSFWRMPLMAASRHESSPIEATACEDNRIGMMGRTGWESGCDSLSLNPPSPAAETIPANQCISEGNNKQVACPGQLIIPSDTLNSDMNSLDSVRDIVDDYILDLDYVGIEITEIMEFEHN